MLNTVFIMFQRPPLFLWTAFVTHAAERPAMEGAA